MSRVYGSFSWTNLMISCILTRRRLAPSTLMVGSCRFSVLVCLGGRECVLVSQYCLCGGSRLIVLLAMSSICVDHATLRVRAFSWVEDFSACCLPHASPMLSARGPCGRLGRHAPLVR